MTSPASNSTVFTPLNLDLNAIDAGQNGYSIDPVTGDAVGVAYAVCGITIVPVLPVNDMQGTSPSEKTTVDLSKTTFGVIEDCGDHDWFKVHLDAGAYYLKSVRNTIDYTVGAFDNGSPDSFRPLMGPRVMVRDQNGTELPDGGNSFSNADNEKEGWAVFSIRATGDYFLDIYSACFLQQGAYGFDVKPVYDDSIVLLNPKALTVDVPQRQGLDYGGDTDYFAVDLQAGRTYVFYANSNNVDTNLVLHRQDDTIIALNDDGNLGPEFDAEVAARKATTATEKFSIQKSFKDYNARIEYTPTDSGKYYIEAGSARAIKAGFCDVAAMDVTDEMAADDVGSSLAQSNALVANAPAKSGVIGYVGDHDWYQATLLEGVTYLLRAQVAPGAGALLDPLLRLRGSDGSYKVFNNDLTDNPYAVGYEAGGSWHDALLVYTPTTSGSYFLDVAGAGNLVGRYLVSAVALDDAPANTATTQKVRVNNQAVTGHIEVAGDSDWFAVYLTAGTPYEFAADRAAAVGLVDPLLSLRDGAGALLASNDDAVGVNALIRYTPERSGWFYLDVQDTKNGVGNYKLTATAQDDFANGFSTTGRIGLSAAVGGNGTGAVTASVDYGGDLDYLKVDFLAGQVYTIRMKGAGTGIGLTLDDPRIYGIYTAAGSLVTQSGNDDFGDTRDSLVTFRTPSAGSYYLAVGGSNLNSVGTYQLSIEAQSPQDLSDNTATRADLAVGQSLSSTLGSKGDTDWFRVNLTAQATYVIDLIGDVTSQTMLSDPLLKGVYDSAGQLVANTTNNNYGASLNSRMTFTPSQSGTYYLSAGSNNQGTGDYNIYLSQIATNQSDDMGALPSSHGHLTLRQGSGTLDGRIDYFQDIDWIGVELQQGVTYEITLRGAASGMGTLLDPRLNGIYDNNGKIIIGTGVDGGDGGVDVRTRFTATASATYYIAAGGTADMVGSYRVEVKPTVTSDDVQANINTTAEVFANGLRYENQIETVGDVDWVKAHLKASSQYLITLQGVNGSMGKLPNGALLTVVNSAGISVPILSLPEQVPIDNYIRYRLLTTNLPEGDYYLAIGEPQGNTGAYALTVSGGNNSAALQTLMDFGPVLATVNGASFGYGGAHTIQSDWSKATALVTLPYDASLKLTFNNAFDVLATPSNVHKGMGRIQLIGKQHTITMDVNSDAVQITGNIVTINPPEDLNPSEKYALSIDRGAFLDQLNNPFGGLGVQRKTFTGSQSTNVSINDFYDPNELIIGTNTTKQASSGKAAWTIMVYMDADNAQEAQALADLAEMASVTLPSDVKLIVKLDRALGYSDALFAGSNETGTATYQLTPTGWQRLTSVTEDNMGDPATLSSFISSSITNSPANNYGLIVWGPGGGIYGTAWDQASSMDNLTIPELKQGLTVGLTNGSVVSKLGVLAFDSSLMSMLEVVQAVKDNTALTVATEEIMPASGFNYQTVLGALAANSAMSANELATTMVNAYANQYAGELSMGIGAYRSSALDSPTSNTAGMLAWLERFASAMVLTTTQYDWDMVREAFSATLSTPTHDGYRDFYRDMGDFFTYLYDHAPAKGTSPLWIAQVVKDRLWPYATYPTQPLFVPLTYVSPDSDSRGLGIYLPVGTEIDAIYTAENFPVLAQIPSWPKFLKKLQEMTNAAPYGLTVTSVASTLAAGHVLENLDAASGYALADDLKVALLSYSDDWAKSNNVYSLSGDDARRFRIVDNALYLQKGTRLQYNDPDNSDHAYSVTVQVNDSSLNTLGANSSQTYTVSIDQLDVTAPVFTSASRVQINAGATAVTTVSASDSSAVTYSLAALGNASLFNVTSAGVITFKAAATAGVYDLTVVATDTSGNQSSQKMAINVWSASMGPVILAATPADDTTQIALNSNIVLTYNEPVQRGAGTITLKTLAGTTVESYAQNSSRVTLNGSTLTIDPSAQLSNNTTYIVELASGAVTDTTSSRYVSQAVTSYNFKTIAGIAGVATGSNDTVAPVLSASTAAAAVPVDSILSLSFSEAIQRGTGSILLKSAGTSVETIDIASSKVGISPDGRTLTVDPAKVLSTGTPYTLELAAGVVRDAAGNANAPASYAFSTETQKGYSIQLDYSDASISSTDATKLALLKSIVTWATGLWEDVIIGDLPDFQVSGGGVIDDMKLNVVVNDNIGDGILGMGGIQHVRSNANGGLPYEGKIIINTTGLDSASVESFKTTIAHEMGHALGIGSLWARMGLSSVFGEYTGAEALKVYQGWKNDKTLTYVPLETTGGTGTANVHWSEAIFGKEMMTGYTSGSVDPISALTLASLKDLGYVVDVTKAGTYALAGSTIAPLLDTSNMANASLLQSNFVI